MAEGDVILRLAERIDLALAGQRLRARCPHPRGKAAGLERLDRRRLESAQARGKHLLLSFDDDLVLHSHLAMSGSWRLYRRGERWARPGGAAWLVLEGEREEAVQWGGPTLRLLDARQLARDPRLARLGVDLLAEDFRVEAAVRSLRRGEPSTALGEALLDQRLVAGIGNVYKSEGCFAAGADPWRPLRSLSDAELGTVLGVTRELMQAGVKSARQPHAVYSRSRQPCQRCGAPIRSRAQGDSARKTFWCESCQA
jgi:endonuclease VIII